MLEPRTFESQSRCACDAQSLQPFGECQCTKNLIAPFRISQFFTKKFGNVDSVPYIKSVTKSGNSRLEITLAAKLAELETLQYQIDHLQNYYSREQIRIWKTRRKNLKGFIRLLKSHVSLILKSRTCAK